MSWIVENLLRNKLYIKENPDLESDEYNNYLVLERKIEDLEKIGVITKEEISIIDLLSQGNSIDDIRKELHLHRTTASSEIKRICSKIAYYLGDIYTDVGYVAYMQAKYNLSYEDVIKLGEYMSGRYNKKIMRKND